MIRFKCDNCGRGIKTDDAKIGQQGVCPGCHQVVQIPSELMAADLVTASAATLPHSPPNSDGGGFWQSRAGTVFALTCATFVLPLLGFTCLFDGASIAMMSYVHNHAVKKQNAKIEQLEEVLERLYQQRLNP